MSNSDHSSSYRSDWPDAQFCFASPLLIRLYTVRWFPPILLKTLLLLESGEFFSGTLRVLLSDIYGVTVGEYSYGACMAPGKWPRGVSVGPVYFCGARRAGVSQKPSAGQAFHAPLLL